MKRYELENLTGKHLNLYNMAGKYINNIPMSDQPVPMYEKGTEPCGILRGIPLVTQDFRHIENLPEPKEGTYYIVLKPIALGCPKRKDLLIPGPLVRNDRGEPCGYRGLTRILSFKDCQIINQTGHDINVYDRAVNHLRDFPAAGEEVPRCNEEQEINQEYINNFPVTWQFLGDVVNLPDEQPGTFYIVSRMVALAAPERRDLLIPGPLIKEKDGEVIGCKGLTRVNCK